MNFTFTRNIIYNFSYIKIISRLNVTIKLKYYVENTTLYINKIIKHAAE